ncbi:MAG: sigma-54 dependent transcriptional regulator [Thermodesulfobacteriota bacterium]|nr:sigma-54 dependent transcriptional regulator [Thermodesulfobacteriota bacterium]
MDNKSKIGPVDKNTTSSKRILLVDDEEDILVTTKKRLKLFGYEDVITASDPIDALKIFKDQEGTIDLLLSDQRMNNMSGQELMEKCRKIDPDLQTIIFTAYGTIENAVEAVKAGAFSYVEKPINHEDLALKIKGALEKRELLKKVADLERIVVDQFQFADMIGTSPQIKAVFRQIVQVAPIESTITIYGESGTGKELVANAIHFHSQRNKESFVAVNCAAIPETLLEDEFFGHVKGAYTGAVSNKIGFFRQAHKGTLFLDEVGEMSEAMQAKLLRVIETGEIKPLGNDNVHKVDVRLIVATQRDLGKLVKEGRFREDLYYRVHVVPITIPPLRERREDILLLMQHFFKKYETKMGKDIKKIEGDVIDGFRTYTWPGNVRELKNVVEYLVAICTGNTITSAMFANTSLAGSFLSLKKVPLREAKDEFIKKYLEDLFRITKGNVSRAAKSAGYYRADFYKLFQKYGMNPKNYCGTKKAVKTEDISSDV